MQTIVRGNKAYHSLQSEIQPISERKTLNYDRVPHTDSKIRIVLFLSFGECDTSFLMGPLPILRMTDE